MRNGGSHPEIQIGLPVFPIGNTKYSTERNTDTTSNVPNTKHSLGGVPDRNTNTVVSTDRNTKSEYETLTGTLTGKRNGGMEDRTQKYK